MKVTIQPKHIVSWCCEKHYEEVASKDAEIQRLREEIPKVQQRTLDWAAKEYGCHEIGPDCPGRCIARCEDLPNLRVTLAAYRAVVRELVTLVEQHRAWMGPPPKGPQYFDSLREDAWAEGNRLLAHPLVQQAPEER